MLTSDANPGWHRRNGDAYAFETLYDRLQTAPTSYHTAFRLEHKVALARHCTILAHKVTVPLPLFTARSVAV